MYEKLLMKKNKDKKIDWDFIAWIVVVIIGITFWSIVSDKIGEFFNSDAKDYCSKSYKVKSAQTDYAAKLAYKECMRNY